MPIEVRELIIKATVEHDSDQGNTSATGGNNNAQRPSEEMINTCVERILEILKEKMER